MIPLVIGIVLALAAMSFVLAPLFIEGMPRRAAAPRRESEDQDSAIAALREIEFDRATGKLAEHDYQVLSERYTRRAVEEMRREGSETVASDDAVEALIRRFRDAAASCPACGPRPEGDAVYCSNCGRFLPGNCKNCGAEINESSARFCASCGTDLAA